MALSTVFGVLGGVVLVRDLVRGDPQPVTANVKTPPSISIEVKARAGDSAFNDDVAAVPGEQIQVFTVVKNTGETVGEGATAKIRLPRYVELQSGSCRIRRSDSAKLSSCEDNIVGGGFSVLRLGGGAWWQIYFYARLTNKVPPERVLMVRGTVNSDETKELKDVARIHTQSGWSPPPRTARG